ncbi:7670_t:CDS:2 [Funneliformis caledonium]|uniref:7670_t:CDS:1 n=1 Tax=Funneliformis caledonium TaxID=1117310 RepID=A0A9N9CL24_9GLOM|nr:7670_t:CDS:2 [Funneliformis caledonium]
MKNNRPDPTNNKDLCLDINQDVKFNDFITSNNELKPSNPKSNYTFTIDRDTLINNAEETKHAKRTGSNKTPQPLNSLAMQRNIEVFGKDFKSFPEKQQEEELKEKAEQKTRKKL